MQPLSRRTILAGLALMPAVRAGGTLAWDVAVPAIEGGTLDFAAYRGRVLLVTNTASFCGYAPQFHALEALNRSQKADGLTVIGMPSNDFNQEADSNARVQELCQLTYDVDFPMAGLSHVRGADANPFYTWVRAVQGWEPDWNFNKVLIGRGGRVLGHYPAAVAPDSAVLRDAIAGALAAQV